MMEMQTRQTVELGSASRICHSDSALYHFFVQVTDWGAYSTLVLAISGLRYSRTEPAAYS
jgi:hypothetical protein